MLFSFTSHTKKNLHHRHRHGNVQRQYSISASFYQLKWWVVLLLPVEPLSVYTVAGKTINGFIEWGPGSCVLYITSTNTCQKRYVMLNVSRKENCSICFDLSRTIENVNMFGNMWLTVANSKRRRFLHTIGESKGGAGTDPPGHPNSFDIMQFSGNFGKIVCWWPPPPPRRVEILDPPLHTTCLSAYQWDFGQDGNALT